jgi:two-component system sensor histidine kinase QseC
VLLRVLLRNLLDNASRYGGSGAHIVVQLQTQGPAQPAAEVHLTVQDSGPGLSEAQMARLGERFFRVLGHTQTGSGLGWSIVRRIALATGAQVQVGRCAELGGLQVQLCWAAMG